jgi:hypothetical protein
LRRNCRRRPSNPNTFKSIEATLENSSAAPFRSMASLSIFDVSLSELEFYIIFAMNKQVRYTD